MNPRVLNARIQELQAEVERLLKDNELLLIQVSMCRARMSERGIEAVCKQMKELKQRRARDEHSI